MITLSTHVLDSVTGSPASGMVVWLDRAAPPGSPDGPAWIRLGSGVSDADGRLKSWGERPLAPGGHRLTFATGPWFASLYRECFYPEVSITFTVEDDGSHYHVPLLLAPYAYSTYRGS